MSSSLKVLVAAAAATVLFAGCAGDGDEPPAATSAVPVSPASTVAPAESVESWADDVCTASEQLRATVRDVSAAVPVEVAGDTTARDQARQVLSDRVAAVGEAARSLGTAVTSLPPDADPTVVAAKNELQVASAYAEEAVTGVRAAAEKVTGAADAGAAAAAVPGVSTAVATARAAVAAYGDALRAMVNSADTAARPAPRRADLEPGGHYGDGHRSVWQ
jgi:hypothetical protein